MMGQPQKRRLLEHKLSYESPCIRPEKKQRCMDRIICDSEDVTSLIKKEEQTNSILAPNNNCSENPNDYLKALVSAVLPPGKKIQVTPATKLGDGFFAVATEEQRAGYTMEVVSAVRNNNVDELHNLRGSGNAIINCFNTFGESLLHMSCRRGFKEMTEFLLSDPTVHVRVADDCGRTPMTDTCWSPTPQLDIAKWILEREPSLLFVADKRGFTPLDYVRPEHWPIWKKFLYDNRSCLIKLETKHVYTRFCR